MPADPEPTGFPGEPGDLLPDGKKASVESHFSWLRTRMSTERTLMSWVRTATALIGFGFTIAQFLAKVNQVPGVPPPMIPGLPRIFGLSLVALGTLALGAACYEYILLVGYLRGDQFRPIRGVSGLPKWTPALPVALLLTAVGLITFVTLLIRTR